MSSKSDNIPCVRHRKIPMRHFTPCRQNNNVLKKFAGHLILPSGPTAHINKKRKIPFALSCTEEDSAERKGKWNGRGMEEKGGGWYGCRDDERTDSGTQCAGAAEVLEEALRFWVMTLFESRSRIVNGASGSGVISYLDLRAGWR